MKDYRGPRKDYKVQLGDYKGPGMDVREQKQDHQAKKKKKRIIQREMIGCRGCRLG